MQPLHHPPHEDHFEVNSESDNSVSEPNKDTAIHIPPSKTFT